ncbi:hypothetical protein [Paenibacillus sp. 481]|uniref:hypothetical protein n=1 Tax=Paenibacillus sp. 481 TaxID=2835869 RepID=UPI001E2DFBAE|nr:hypothetical protein [Paenibacillus sp. 481]UHA74287.1 hypothetical protein KIK04_03900 [Paenibacillus sp. 481]
MISENLQEENEQLRNTSMFGIGITSAEQELRLAQEVTGSCSSSSCSSCSLGGGK